MKIYDNWCEPDEGKQFVLTQKGKDECVSLKYEEVGKPVEDWERIPTWAYNSKYFQETDIPGFIFGLDGYKVGYYHKNGMFLHCGNPQTFPTRKAAEVFAKHYASYPWFDEEIAIVDAKYNGIPLSEPKTYKGKPIVDNEHYFGLNAHEIGELFTTEVVEWFRDCVPPAWYSSELIQCGEPSNHINGKATYSTFKRIDKDIWEYCGDCYRGKNVIEREDL